MYNDCLRPIETSCPRGVRIVYDTENGWYRELQIASYLCDEKLDGKDKSTPRITKS